ncbi:hypothetical protein, partial [Chromobacterium amazonense]|uniref:hypothetical protein n=1 Tax=Chromobacterium amazonense TaxID=1382803 RepID=UPI0021B723AB
NAGCGNLGAAWGLWRQVSNQFFVITYLAKAPLQHRVSVAYWKYRDIIHRVVGHFNIPNFQHLYINAMAPCA